MSAAGFLLDLRRRRAGDERFHSAGVPLEIDLLSFWQWACSDIVGNSLRGRVAEYFVACAVGAHEGLRTEWDAYDVLAPDGTKIEVKSSAYLQSWRQTKPSDIRFSIEPKRGWDAETNVMADVASRVADVYVFSVHAHEDKATLDPLNVAQWDLYVLPTSVLNESCPTQKSIGLSSLLKLRPAKVSFGELGGAIAEAAGKR